MTWVSGPHLFQMVLVSQTTTMVNLVDGFSMVANHWSSYGLVTLCIGPNGFVMAFGHIRMKIHLMAG